MNKGLWEFASWILGSPQPRVFPFDQRKLYGDISETTDSDDASQLVSMVFSEK